MKNDLDHLPDRKQRELAAVVDVLHQEFDAWSKTVKPRNGKAEGGEILKIILFGSYARGTWVDEPHTMKGYKSDYDILVIVNKDYVVNAPGVWAKAEDRFLHDEFFQTPVQIITHTLKEVNERLGKGQYFFSDIAKEGIALYELKGHKLREPKPLTPHEAYEAAKEYFEEKMESAEQFSHFAKDAIARGWNKKAAFFLHQMTENLYDCFLLVHTNYAPATHDLRTLHSMSESRSEELRDIWPEDTKHARRSFQLLRRAYVEARYSKHFRITEEELSWLHKRIAILMAAILTSIKDKLQNLPFNSQPRSL